MASLSIWGTLVALFIVMVVLTFLAPTIKWFGNATVEHTFGIANNGSVGTQIYHNVTAIYNPTNRTAFNNSNGNLGFNIFNFGAGSSSAQLSPFSFIYGAFSSFLETMQYLAPNISGVISTVVGMIGGGIGVSFAVGVLFSFITTMYCFRMLLVGVSAWMKTNLLVL